MTNMFELRDRVARLRRLDRARWAWLARHGRCPTEDGQAERIANMLSAAESELARERRLAAPTPATTLRFTAAIARPPRPSRPPVARPLARRRTPLPRPAARRPGHRRTGARAGTDPGDDGGSEPEPGLPGWLTFETFHRLTPDCSGPERLARFSRLASEVQDATWRALARDFEEAR